MFPVVNESKIGIAEAVQKKYSDAIQQQLAADEGAKLNQEAPSMVEQRPASPSKFNYGSQVTSQRPIQFNPDA